ncbi:MAG TPA: Mur ligase domain-containing protein, partial [Salinimicrobium sp.]|nr:Mur ligase domain-containing protein [Salinimicrobium sp.]
MILLRDILYKVSLSVVVGNTAVEVNEIRFDSRKVGFNDVFVAIKGLASDGHDFIEQAVNQGALAIICQKLPDNIVNGVTYVKVENSGQALAIIASNFYGNPSENLKLVGITGTNGKTNIASLLFQMFSKAGFRVGLLSTVEI